MTNPYELIKANPKVAVLLDNAVVSSGEAIAISFTGRENTKSFGSATCGKSTGNVQYNLSYNRTLVLTTVFLADRNRKLYGVSIIPVVEAKFHDVIPSAVEWLRND